MVLVLGVVACSNDVGDLFANDGGGGTASITTNAAGPAAGPGAVGSTVAAQSASAAQASQASASVATTTNAATSSAVVAQQASSTSSGPPGPTIACGQDVCDLAAGEVCCLFELTGGTSCKTQCDFTELTIRCDDPTDCNGQACCGTLDPLQATFDQVECTNSCNADNERTLCKSDGDCDQGACQPSSVVSGVFQVCTN